MTANTGIIELDRALSRPDATHLRHVVRAYHDWRVRPDQWEYTDYDEIDEWFDSAYGDHEKALALIKIAAATYDDPKFLGEVAAGLLKELFWADRGASDEIIARILSEAKRTPRIRWMLSGVWLYSAKPEHVALVKTTVGEFSMDRGVALPPMIDR